MMKKNSLTFSVFGILALLTLMSLASAAVTINTSTTSLSQTSGSSFAITVNGNTGDTLPTFSPVLTTPYITHLDANGKNITFSFSSLVAFVTGTPQTVIVTYNVDSKFVFEMGKDYYVTINAAGATPPSITIPFVKTNEPTEVSTCKVTGAANATNHLGISVEDVSVLSGFGSDNEWYPLDEVEVKVNVENKGNLNDIRSIVVKWGLYNKVTQKRIAHGEEKSFSLKDNDEKTVKIDFKLDASSDFKNYDNYAFYVWASGDDKELDIKTCTSDSEDITVITDNPFVILDSLQIVGTASCGDTVQVSGKVWNIGDDDENDIYLKVYNTELGISQRVDVGDVDQFNSKDLLFNLVIPSDAEDGKSYDLTFLVYDDSDDIFESSNGDKAQFTIPITIASGSCSVEVPAVVTANVETAAKAGEEFSVKATITNTASTKKNFNLEFSGYEDWATFVSVDKSSVLTLEAGKSTDVLIKLKANEGVSGDKSFNIVLKDGSKVLTQAVPVSVQGVGFNITGLFAGLGGNAYLWAIGALNVLLVLIIIVVAVRVVRKK